MLEAFGEAVLQMIRPDVAIAMILASTIAVILGVIPGLAGPLGMILFLPFIHGSDPFVSLCVLSCLAAVGTTGGSITAILIGVPGQASNAATILDGFAMTRKGEGARAIGAGLGSSMFGGLLAVGFAFVMIPAVVPVVMAMRTPEMFCLILVGLSFLAVLTEKSVLKGLISAALGLLIASIGYQAKTGIARFTLGNVYLYDGIQIVVMLLGILAIPVMAELVVAKKTISPVDMKAIGTYRSILRGVLDVFHYWWLWIRCTAIGYIVGVIPGIGGETAIWVSYAHAKQTSKSPDTFGTGNIEGVIAPESANNARDSGSTLTTLALGIPGSSSMVMLLAGFLLVGIVPGPRVLIEHTSLCFAVISANIGANIWAGLLCFAALPFLIKITRVPTALLFCYIMPIIMIGVYSYRLSTLDILILVFIGALGVGLRRFGYSAPAILLGYILGNMFEYYLWQSLDLHGPLFFLSPICLVLLGSIVTLLSKDIWSPLIRNIFKPRAGVTK